MSTDGGPISDGGEDNNLDELRALITDTQDMFRALNLRAPATLQLDDGWVSWRKHNGKWRLWFAPPDGKVPYPDPLWDKAVELNQAAIGTCVAAALQLPKLYILCLQAKYQQDNRVVEACETLQKLHRKLGDEL